MKNKLELVWSEFQKLWKITSQMENAHKKVCCIFKTMFTMRLNTLNYIYNALNYKKLCTKLYVNFFR